MAFLPDFNIFLSFCFSGYIASIDMAGSGNIGSAISTRGTGGRLHYRKITKNVFSLLRSRVHEDIKRKEHIEWCTFCFGLAERAASRVFCLVSHLG
jgi:hypothetical protein